MAWTCVGCGEVHGDLPTSYRTGPPVLWQQLSPADQKRSLLDEEVCLVRREGGEDAFFIRGNAEIPIVDAQGGTFVWTVWCSLSAENFKTTARAWKTAGREQAAPMFSWLSSELTPYPSTLNLPTMLHAQPVGQRPTIEVQAAGHALAVEQRSGITMRRVEEIAAAFLHS
jgi:hypothetical protein